MAGRNGQTGQQGAKPNRQQQIKRQVRRERREEKARERFIRTPTPKQARRQARAEVNTVYRPQERRLGAEFRASAQREKDLGSWYGGLDAQAAADATNAQAQQAAILQSLGQRADAANKQDAATLATLTGADSAMAERLGGPANTPTLAKLAAGNAAAATNRVALDTPIAQEGANFGNYLSGRRLGVAVQGLQARKEESARQRKTREDQGALKKEGREKLIEQLGKIREGARDFSVSTAALGSKDKYSKAIENQAKLGLAGKQASANAQVTAASIYANAKITGASIQKEIARLQKQGDYRTARALEQQAKTYSENSGKGGYTVNEAASLAREAGINFKTPGEVVDYLVNRGVKRGVAKKATNTVWSAAQGGK